MELGAWGKELETEEVRRGEGVKGETGNGDRRPDNGKRRRGEGAIG